MARMILLLLLCAGCAVPGDGGWGEEPEPTPPESNPTGTLKVEDGYWRFTDVGADAGIQDRWGTNKGAGFADLDGDGDYDLMLGNVNTPSPLLINQLAETGVLTFVPHPSPPTVEIPWGIAFADYDNDGDTDLFIACGGFYIACTDGLFRNDGVDPSTGHVVLSDATAGSGLGDEDYHSMHGSWVDFDRDGLLDLYLAVRVESEMWGQDSVGASSANRLFCNLGGGVFEDVAPAVGLDDSGDSGSVAWADFNGDGWLDVFVPNLMGTNTLYLSDEGQSFAATSSGFARPHLAFGSAALDIEGDGDFDIVVDEYHQGWVAAGGFAHQGHALYINDGEANFTESADALGLTELIGGGMGTMGFQVGDLDLDGDPEILFGAGGPYPGGGERNRLVSSVVSPTGVQSWEDRSGLFDHPAIGRAADEPTSPYPYRTHASIFVDINGDDAVDLFMGNGGVSGLRFGGEGYEPNRLWINESDLPNQAVWLDLVGTQSNADGIGSDVTITDELGWSRRHQMQQNRGFAASVPAILALGVGARVGPFELVVRWPSGEETTVTGVEPGAHITITESGG